MPKAIANIKENKKTSPRPTPPDNPVVAALELLIIDRHSNNAV